MNINRINNLAYALASRDRAEKNRNKRVNQKGWVTKEQVNRNAAAMAGQLIIWSLLVAFASKLFTMLYGKKVGICMMLVLAIGFPVCLLSDSFGTNVAWIPLWMAVVAFVVRIVVKMCLKIFDRKWGLIVSISAMVAISIWLWGEFKTLTVKVDKPSSFVEKRNPDTIENSDDGNLPESGNVSALEKQQVGKTSLGSSSGLDEWPVLNEKTGNNSVSEDWGSEENAFLADEIGE